MVVQRTLSEEKHDTRSCNDENKKTDDDSSTRASEDKHITADWEEQLWAAARAHYLEALSDEHSESSSEHIVTLAEDDLRNDEISNAPQTTRLNEIGDTENVS